MTHKEKRMPEDQFVNIDHYNGRAVEDVNQRGNCHWQIVLEGDVRIVNYDDSYPMPDKSVLKQLKLQHAVLDASDTTLWFGTDENPRSTVLHLSPQEYGIADTERFDGVVKPQAGGMLRDPVEDRPVEPAERLQEGPEAETEGATTPETETAGEGE